MMPDLTVICPAFNEEARVHETVSRLRQFLQTLPLVWQVVLVNDGSTDQTEPFLREAVRDIPQFAVVSYPVNHGRGEALRRGFQAATGRIVVTMDFDLSYREEIIAELYRALEANPEAHMALASVHMPGGQAVSVPWGRLLLSRWANRIIRICLGSNIRTWTCVVRGYRREALEELAPVSAGKEIHLEMLGKALAKGFRVVEIPARLEGRSRAYPLPRLFADVVAHLRVLAAIRLRAYPKISRGCDGPSCKQREKRGGGVSTDRYADDERRSDAP